MWISPSYQDVDYPFPHSLDTKIILFEDRTFGWKLDIADQIINGKKGDDGTEERPPIPNSGFAALDIVFSYFEMIAKYEAGFTRTRNSRDYFKLGVSAVFPEYFQPKMPTRGLALQGNVITLFDQVLDTMYEGIRCGLYHSGITNGKVMLTAAIETPLAFDLTSEMLVINPHLLVPRLKTHLGEYVRRLRDVNNLDLRNKFEARYDFDTRV
jgi:hypothetical protein